jgi:hypothetical protein
LNFELSPLRPLGSPRSFCLRHADQFSICGYLRNLRMPLSA